MPRASLTASLAAIVAACAVGVPVAIATAASSHSHTAEVTRALAGSAAALTEDSAGTRTVPGSQRDTVEIWMAGDQPAAQRFVTAVSTPGSRIYRRYLSPIAYTQRFGPTRGQVKAVQLYLTGQGFTAVHASVNDDYVSATAPVTTINRAFSVQMRRYETAGTAGKRTAVESNDRDLTVPSTISRDILAVTGLNSSQPQVANAAIPTADTTAPCSTYWAQKIETLTPAFRGLTQAADAVCGYSAKQMRAAYGLTPADTGKGRTVAIIQVGGPSRMFQSLTDYAKANGLPAPRADQYREQAIGQGDSNPKCVNEDLEEGALDSEAVYAMAPAAHQLVIDGDDCLTSKQDGNQALFDAMLAPLTGPGAKPSASIESVSYGLLSKNESTTPRSQLKVTHEIALRAAAEGVSLLAATGDDPGVEALASDPDITAVGGTTLGIGADNRRLFETGWSTAFGERRGTTGPWQDKGILLGTSGGVSSVYAEPAYQRGVVPSAMALNPAGKPGRTLPDISADADPKSGMLLGLIVNRPNGTARPYATFTQAGTSLAAPLVAGIVADAEQGQSGRLGFLNPRLYALAGSSAFHDALPLSPSDPQTDRAYSTTGPVDIDDKFSSGFIVGVNDAQDETGTKQVTATGYDTMTGLGTPNGTALIQALRANATSGAPKHTRAAAGQVRSATVALADSAVPFTRLTPAAGALDGVKPLTVQVWLRPNLSAAQRYATSVSTPGNSMYRDFLSPDEYTARFGPTPQEASAVTGWLRSRGFATVETDTQRDYVRATATVARIDAIFHTTIKTYPGSDGASGGGAVLHANARALTVPARLAPDMLGVTGLDSAIPTVPSEQRDRQASTQADEGQISPGPCSAYWGQRMVSGLPAMFGTTKFPAVTCGYTPTQFRSAYGANMINTGQGQTIAFAEAGGLEAHMFASLQDFTAQFHLPAPAAARYKELNLQPASCTKHDESAGEEEMDVESAYAMAPGATQLVVGADLCDTGDSGFQGAFNADLAIINGNGTSPLASVVSNSWETGYDDQPTNLNQIETAFLLKAAAVGVGMYYSAGDTPCTTQPASNPYATGVGATTLAIGKSGQRLFETGGAIGFEGIKNEAWTKPSYFGYGGGQSLVYPQPAYQKGVVPANMSTPLTGRAVPGQAECRDGGPPPRPGTSPMRSAPDVSASDGNAEVGLINYKGKYVDIVDGGTSLSAPLVAGMVVAAQQGQTKPFGFLNPALYTLTGTPALYDPRPVTTRDPLLWRAEICPKSVSACGGPTRLWVTDDQSPAARGYSEQMTTKGYDNTTGVGVPHGQAFITALRKLS